MWVSVHHGSVKTVRISDMNKQRVIIHWLFDLQKINVRLFAFAPATANYLKLCNICRRLHLHNPCILEDGKIPLHDAVSSTNSMLHGLVKQIQCGFFLLDDNLRENSVFLLSAVCVGGFYHDVSKISPQSTFRGSDDLFINFYVKLGGPSDAHRSEFHDVKRSFVKESEGQLLRKLNKWPIRICPSLQSWKIRIINQPQKGSSKEQAAQKRAFDSINQTFLILIPWSHHHHHRGKHKKNKTFHSPVWRCQTYKSSICAFARATHHLGMWKKWKSTIVISRRAFRIQFLN